MYYVYKMHHLFVIHRLFERFFEQQNWGLLPAYCQFQSSIQLDLHFKIKKGHFHHTGKKIIFQNEFQMPAIISRVSLRKCSAVNIFEAKEKNIEAYIRKIQSAKQSHSDL